MRFEDKVAIVTGAASGIGLATARQFASEGAHVVIADLNLEKAESAADDVKRSGLPEPMAVRCDVAQEEQVIQVVKTTLERWGQFHVIVNNAGLMIFKPLE